MGQTAVPGLCIFQQLTLSPSAPQSQPQHPCDLHKQVPGQACHISLAQSPSKLDACPTFSPVSSSSSATEPTMTISSPSSDIHTGKGVPQNLLRLTAQSRACTSIATAKVSQGLTCRQAGASSRKCCSWVSIDVYAAGIKGWYRAGRSTLATMPQTLRILQMQHGAMGCTADGMPCLAALAHLRQPVLEALLANMRRDPVRLLIVGNQAVLDLSDLHKPAGHCLHWHASSIWLLVRRVTQAVLGNSFLLRHLQGTLTWPCMQMCTAVHCC